MANTDLRDLLAWAASEKLPVTSSSTGRHNVGSKHYLGQAIDVDHKAVKDVNAFYKDAQAQGFRIRDERQRPPGQAVWGGPHFHVEIDNAARRGQRPQPAQRVAPASQSTQPVKPQGGSVDELLRQAEVSINGYRQQIQKQAGIATASGTFKQGVLPTRTDYNYSKPSTMNPLQSAWQGFQQPFNPYASQPEGLSGMAGEFAGRAALPVLAGLAGGGLPLIAGAGAATGAIREDTRQRKYNETPNLGKIGLSAATESLVAAPFLKGGFVPNALMGGGIAGAQSAVDQLNSTGQIDPGTLAKDAAMGGVLSGGLGKFFGPKPVPDIPAPDAIPDLRLLSGGRDPLRLTGGLEAPKALPGAVDVQTPGGAVLRKPAGMGARGAPEVPSNVIDIQARPTEPNLTPEQLAAEQEAWRMRTVGEPKPIETGLPTEGQATRDILNNPTTEQVSDTGLVVAKEGPKGPAPELIDPSTGRPFASAAIPQPSSQAAPSRPVFAKKADALQEALSLGKQTGTPHEVTTSGGMHFVHEVGNNAGLENIKVPRGEKVTVNGEEFTLQGQAGGMVRVKNATGDRIIPQDLIERLLPKPIAETPATPVQPQVQPDIPQTAQAAPIDVAQELAPQPQPQQPATALDTPEARLKRGNVVAPGDPESIMSAQDLQAKKPGVYESLDPKRQAVVNRIGEAIQSGEVLEAPYMPKKGDTGQVGVKAFKPSHMSAAGNTLEVFGTNIEGQPNRLIIEDFRNPGASWGFQDVPTPSSQVVPDVATQPREAITPRAQSEAAIAQVKKLSEIAPNNRAVQNATRILEKDNLTIKDINRAKRVLEDGAATDEHLRGMMDQLKASEGTSNCG